MKSVLIILLLLFRLCVDAQTLFEVDKFDYEWIIGQCDIGYDTCGNLIRIDETGLSAIQIGSIAYMKWDCSAISDENGDLLFYSEGQNIYDKSYSVMENGDAIYGNGWSNNITHGSVFLPVPGSSMEYYLFHSELLLGDPEYQVGRINYSKIDVTLNNGLGAVTEKRIAIAQDSFDYGLIAVRHANGRDWWLYVHKSTSASLSSFLIDPSGVHTYPTQPVGTWTDFSSGQSVVSPDGTKLAQYFRPSCSCPGEHTKIYDIDRCTGILSNELSTTPIGEGTNSGWGAAFSPNSQYLFTTDAYFIRQYDMWSDDPTVPVYEVASDGQTPGPGGNSILFRQMRLGADNKIYVVANTRWYMSVINNPNELGEAIDLCQQCIELPAYNSNGAIVNAPSYRVGPIDGSSCDTLGLDMPLSAVQVPRHNNTPRISPNPATEYFLVQFDVPQRDGAKIMLYNTLGEVVLTQALRPMVSTIYLSGLASGAYFYSIESGGAAVGSGKVVKL